MNIVSALLSYVRSGNVNLFDGALGNPGGYGYDWSARSYSFGNTVAYGLGFNASDVVLSNNYARYNPFLVRCLV